MSEPGLATPVVDATAWLAAGAILAGRVSLGAHSSVWYNAVVRADGDAITVGEGSNVQDGAVLHADPGFPVSLGSGVTVGHLAVVHGATVEDDVLIGIHATVLNGARIGRESLIAAGSVVLEGTQIPPGSLVAGLPAKVRRELTDDERESIRSNARRYRSRAAQHATGGDFLVTPART